jgi:hypothetical protein
VARVPTVRRVFDSVREVNPLNDPRREPDDVEVSRPSSMPLRDSDLDFVSEDRPFSSATRTSDVSFVSALAQDPDADEPPVVARFKRPPELPRNPASLPPPSAVTPARGGALSGGGAAAASAAGTQGGAMPPALPSMMVAGAAARVRSDTTPTERLSTHPINHSTAPTSAPKTERPPERRGTGVLWLGVAAAVLVGIGLAGLSRYRDQQSQVEPQALAQPGMGSTVVEEKAAPAVEPAAPAPVAPAPAAPAADQAAPSARVDEAPLSPEEQARAEERERRRRERHEARAAAAQAAGSGVAPAPAEGQEAPAAAAAGAATPAAAAPKPADGTLPAQPSRDQVVAAMNAVLPRLQECVGDKHGQANVTITVRAAGFVSYAIVGGTFVGTPEGSCIARVVKEAQFPPFAEPFIRITYPYQL